MLQCSHMYNHASHRLIISPSTCLSSTYSNDTVFSMTPVIPTADGEGSSVSQDAPQEVLGL